MERKAYSIPLYGALSFAYLGFRYGMYSNEGWPSLPYNWTLGEMLIWGITHSVAIFFMCAVTLSRVSHNPKNYQVKLLSLIPLEVLGVGVPSGIFVVKGLIADPWYLATVTLFAGLTVFLSILYVNKHEIVRRREGLDKSDSRFLERLKLEHKRYLQFLSSMCWITFFTLIGYLSLFPPAFAELVVPLPSLLRLFVVNVTGLIYFCVGIVLGVIWQIIIIVTQIEDMIFKLPD